MADQLKRINSYFIKFDIENIQKFYYELSSFESNKTVNNFDSITNFFN